MDKLQTPGFNRRSFIAGTSALSASAMIGLPGAARAEPPLETTSIRLVHFPAICLAPQYLAEDLLRAEGFTDITYTPWEGGSLADYLDDGKADMTMDPAPELVYAMDTRKSLVAVAGIHSGCYELFGHDGVRAVRDLKGKRIAIYAYGGADHIFMASMLAYVGMDPRKDVEWVVPESGFDSVRLFVEHKADAIMGFPPYPQELRARKVGHVIVNTAQDRPWAQYFCCMVVARRQFAARNPNATKRALRAFLKAADLCATEPERAAKLLVTKGYEPRPGVALEVLKSLPYSRWREANPEDSMRFHALRLYEVGMIKSMPEKLIAQGTDWRFLNELKKELKA